MAFSPLIATEQITDRAPYLIDYFYIRKTTRPVLVPLVLLAALVACAPVRGFPDDPAERSEFSVYYGPASEADYDSQNLTDADRRTIRDRIVRHRLHGYDATYSDFKRRLTTDRNLSAAGGSLVALVLGTVAATTRGDEAARILAAASAGVIGAQGVVDRDLYFRQTLPALIAQMDAARDRVLLAILVGLSQPVTTYTLAHANVDLQRLKDIGSIEGAISTINQQAAEARAEAQRAIEITRIPSYVSTSEPRRTIGSRLRALSSPQILALANDMVGRLDAASPEARAVAQQYVPANSRFGANQTTRARHFVQFLAEFETMTSEREAIWKVAIEAALRS